MGKRCLHCGNKISLLRKFSDEEFCSAEHRQAFQQQQGELALSRLIEAQQRVERASEQAGAARKSAKKKKDPPSSAVKAPPPWAGWLYEAVPAVVAHTAVAWRAASEPWPPRQALPERAVSLRRHGASFAPRVTVEVRAAGAPPQSSAAVREPLVMEPEPSHPRLPTPSLVARLVLPERFGPTVTPCDQRLRLRWTLQPQAFGNGARQPGSGLPVLPLPDAFGREAAVMDDPAAAHALLEAASLLPAAFSAGMPKGSRREAPPFARALERSPLRPRFSGGASWRLGLRPQESRFYTPSQTAIRPGLSAPSTCRAPLKFEQARWMPRLPGDADLRPGLRQQESRFYTPAQTAIRPGFSAPSRRPVTLTFEQAPLMPRRPRRAALRMRLLQWESSLFSPSGAGSRPRVAAEPPRPLAMPFTRFLPPPLSAPIPARLPRPMQTLPIGEHAIAPAAKNLLAQKEPVSRESAPLLPQSGPGRPGQSTLPRGGLLRLGVGQPADVVRRIRESWDAGGWVVSQAADSSPRLPALETQPVDVGPAPEQPEACEPRKLERLLPVPMPAFFRMPPAAAGRPRKPGEAVWAETAVRAPRLDAGRFRPDRSEARTSPSPGPGKSWRVLSRLLPRGPRQRPRVPVWKWAGLAASLVIALALYSFPPSQPKEKGAGETVEGKSSGAPSGLAQIQKIIMDRAAIKLVDDFRSGLGAWQGAGDWSTTWRYSASSFVEPGNLALYSPTLHMRDYSFAFLAQIERRSVNWIFRAKDENNYYAMRIVITRPGPLPEASISRYAVIDGKEQRATLLPLPVQVRNDTVYQVRMEIQGDRFTTYLQGQVVDSFTDSRLPEGGIGFFSPKGDKALLRWVSVQHQYDYLGRLCALLAPQAVRAGGR